MDMEVLTASVDGLRIGYRRAGTGAPLLLLHGAFSDSREWQPQLAGLSDQFDVVAMDCPGAGASDDPPNGFGLSDYADVVARFVSALGFEHAHVGGLSFGSMCALVVCREHPETVRSLLLMSAYAGWAGSLPADEVERRIREAEEAFVRPVDEWGPAFVRTVVGEGAAPSVVAEALARLRESQPARFAPIGRLFLRADLRDVLPAIAVPTLIIAGELDQRSPVPAATAMQAQIPGARLVVIPGASHSVNADAPAAVNAAARAFLSSVGS